MNMHERATKAVPQRFEYPWTEDLYAMEQMHAYNLSIARLIAKWFRRAGTGLERILDFGAGIGTISLVLKQHFQITPFALEIDPLQARVIAERGFAVYSRLEQIIDPLDGCFASNVLEHIENDVGALVAIRERLKLGGVVVIYVPAFQALWSELDEQVGHYRRYNRSTLRASLQNAGFRVVHSAYCDSLGFMALLLLKWLRRSPRKALTTTSMGIYDKWVVPVSLLFDRLGAQYLFGKNVFAVAVREH
jgi:SAM-dependent methyltransferase